jgi:hypothetical protein
VTEGMVTETQALRPYLDGTALTKGREIQTQGLVEGGWVGHVKQAEEGGRRLAR